MKNSMANSDSPPDNVMAAMDKSRISIGVRLQELESEVHSRILQTVNQVSREAIAGSEKLAKQLTRPLEFIEHQSQALFLKAKDSPVQLAFFGVASGLVVGSVVGRNSYRSEVKGLDSSSPVFRERQAGLGWLGLVTRDLTVQFLERLLQNQMGKVKQNRAATHSDQDFQSKNSNTDS